MKTKTKYQEGDVVWIVSIIKNESCCPTCKQHLKWDRYEAVPIQAKVLEVWAEYCNEKLEREFYALEADCIDKKTIDTLNGYNLCASGVHATRKDALKIAAKSDDEGYFKYSGKSGDNVLGVADRYDY